jgi:hypothetical protein
MVYTNTNDPNYSINQSTNLVINKNENDLLSYKREIAQFIHIKNMQSNIDVLKDEVSEFKDMVRRLLEKQ